MPPIMVMALLLLEAEMLVAFTVPPLIVTDVPPEIEPIPSVRSAFPLISTVVSPLIVFVSFTTASLLMEMVPLA